MAVKLFRPTTPSRRNYSVSHFEELTRKKGSEKSLTVGKKAVTGRNNLGRVTTRYRGGAHKRNYRIIDFKRNIEGVLAEVLSIEYDPNRTAHIALLQYESGEKTYIIAPKGLQVGQKVQNGAGSGITVGNSLPLANLPLGTTIHCIALKPGKGAALIRSAGCSAQLVAKEGKYAHVKLSSGEVRLVLLTCRATIGEVGNKTHDLIELGKAGRKRWMGKRPHVRGVAMNPFDHPMGGGEGRSSGGRHPCTPWGKPTKGYKTRKNKTTDKYILKRRTK